jgi:hypothetical protein
MKTKEQIAGLRDSVERFECELAAVANVQGILRKYGYRTDCLDKLDERLTDSWSNACAELNGALRERLAYVLGGIDVIRNIDSWTDAMWDVYDELEGERIDLMEELGL